MMGIDDAANSETNKFEKKFSRTAQAMIGRKIPTTVALDLESAGHTMGGLESMNREKLAELGLSDESIALTHQKRPPIPKDNLNEILYASAYTCVICQDQTRGVIVHHIHPWHESRDHSANNLVVLCTLHHE